MMRCTVVCIEVYVMQNGKALEVLRLFSTSSEVKGA